MASIGFLKDQLVRQMKNAAKDAITRLCRANVLIRGKALPRSPPDAAGSRGCVVILEMAVPEWDANAGARNIYEFIRTLLSDGWTVRYWPLVPADIPAYTGPLRAMGVEVATGTIRPTLARWLRSLARIDLVMICRPDVAQAYLSLVRRTTRAPILFYGHDLHFARMELQAKLNGDIGLLAAAARSKELERWIWRRADASIYPTSEEVAVVRELEPHVIALPVTIFCFDDFPYRTAQPTGANLLFVGSFGHAPNVDAAIWLATEIMPLVRQRHPNVTLSIVGSSPTPAVRALNGDGIHVRGRVSDEELAEIYRRTRVAVVPLRFGAGLKLKVVEALVAGVPLVTTPVGAQGLDGVVPFDVEATADDIARRVGDMLQRDEAQWLERSARGSDYVRARFDRAAMQRSLESAFSAAFAHCGLPMADAPSIAAGEHPQSGVGGDSGPVMQRHDLKKCAEGAIKERNRE